jgi:small-conductance mechanosensitive channel
MPSIVNTVKRFIVGLALLVGLAIVTSILYSFFMAIPISQHDYVSQIINVAIIVAFWATILLFIRRSKPLMTRHLGEHATNILQIFIAVIAVLIMIFAVLNAAGVSPQALLTGAGFASITIGLVVSTFVGGILAGALVFATHKLRVGDSVVVNNIPGTVLELTALVTRIRTDTGIMTIPNSSISSGAIVITKLQKYENIPQRRLPYQVGDRIVTTYMPGEGTVRELTALRTVVALDSGREVTFLNTSVLSGAVAVARVTKEKEQETPPS